MNGWACVDLDRCVDGGVCGCGCVWMRVCVEVCGCVG